jgi:predicted amidohydrolase YtcJ
VAEAVAVKHGRIVSVGSTNELKPLAKKDRQILDLRRKTVTPGSVESHCHPSLTGPKLRYEVDVRYATSIDEIIDLIRQKAEQQPAGKWLRGFG